MSSDDDPEKLLGSSVPPQLSPPPIHPMMGNPKGTPGWDRQIEPRVILGNPKGSIGGVRHPVARLGLLLALLAAIGVAVWRWVL